jgi:hypothetical protein
MKKRVMSKQVRQIRPEDLDAIFAANGSGIVLKAIEEAYAGKVPVLLQCLKEVLAREQSRVNFQLPATLETVEGLIENSRAVIVAHCAGKLTFEQASGIQALLSTHRQFVSAADKKTSNQTETTSESSGSHIEDFMEPIRALAMVTGHKNKMLEIVERQTAVERR